MHKKIASLLVLAVLAIAAPARAQEVTRLPDDAVQSVGIDGGLESAFIARAAYAHRVDLGFLPDSRLFGRFTLPVVGPDLGDWAIDGGLRFTPVEWGDLRLSLLLGPSVRNTSNDVYSATAVGAFATVLFGYEGTRWGLAGELGYEQMFTTHLSHSDLYREIGYADAKDGWYAMTGSTIRGGLRGGARFGAVELAARAGVIATGYIQPAMPPFYFSLGGSYAF